MGDWGIANALWDAERLAGEAGDETLAALWAKHRDLIGQNSPKELTDEESDRFNDKLGDQMTAVEAILSTPAKTMAGARVHIALLAWFHIDGALPYDLQPHVQRLAAEGSAS